MTDRPAPDRSPTRLHPEQRDEVLAVIRELGPGFLERAERYDREASFPYENWAELAERGFLGLCIPRRHGGMGAGFVDYARVAEELGRFCGSTALTFNMHSATCLLAGPIADDLALGPGDQALLDARRSAMFADILDNGTIHSQPFSEGLSGRATSGIATVAEPVEGGYLVSGRKIFASLSEAADMHDVVALVPGDDRVRLLGLAADAEGITITGDWDPLGMRGTISRTLVLDQVFVPAEHEWLPPGVFDLVARRWPFFYMTLSFAYLGIARAVLDFTRAYLRGEIDGSSRIDNPQKQAVWAEMNVLYQQARALSHQVAEEARVDPDDAGVHRAWASMVATMETAPEIASKAIRACGGRSILRPLPLERLYRDARCGATMLPWSVEVCLDRLGRHGLAAAEEPYA